MENKYMDAYMKRKIYHIRAINDTTWCQYCLCPEYTKLKKQVRITYSN